MFVRSKFLRYLCQQSFIKYRQTTAECSKCLQYVYRMSASVHTQQIPTQKVKIKPKVSVEAVNKFVNRTHTCGELTIFNSNENVTLCGWLEHERLGKFLILRDSYGSTQCIIDDDKADLRKLLLDLPLETVLTVNGTVVPRPEGQCNPKMKTGEIEVQVESLEILNTAKQPLPFSIRHFSKAKESLQMQYRYLALRFPELQRNLRLRSWVTMKMREYLINQCEFVDVATPTLFRKTPGGAQEFVVPTKHLGKFYSLVQSPQQFKQLLMVGGIDRYFQMAQCYRDEGSRQDRQPEFTQLDIEMSFVDREDIMDLTENLIANSWPESVEKHYPPFPRLTYEESMETYGTDSPDLRIPGRIHNITDIAHNAGDGFDLSCDLYVAVFSGKKEFLTKSAKEQLIRLAEQAFPKAKLVKHKVKDLELNGLSNLLSGLTRQNIVNQFKLQEKDVILMAYGPKQDAVGYIKQEAYVAINIESKIRQLLGKIRVEFTDIMESKGLTIRESGYKFAWIIDFPLFEIDEDTKCLKTTHHPFTMPHPEDMQNLLTAPLKACSRIAI
ncbi:hypothetical protein TSAR_012504 [Trichomalopsis sarcophagae]|uniref:Aminoacyl-transfer RNA synthetases class-II family profile domain-containing protein n=1 Tax=Trichomalopsis sarcophagae TaxID=543379 RepID=A0A232F245_9HYME|nr:hypothetical protein TSAR_012504 [Trichomalopsis sarcophagae]